MKRAYEVVSPPGSPPVGRENIRLTPVFFCLTERNPSVCAINLFINTYEEQQQTNKIRGHKKTRENRIEKKLIDRKKKTRRKKKSTEEKRHKKKKAEGTTTAEKKRSSKKKITVENRRRKTADEKQTTRNRSKIKIDRKPTD